LFDFEHKQIQGDFLQKRAVSEGVFKKWSLKQHFFGQISANQLQRSNTCSNCFFSYSCNKLYKKQGKCIQNRLKVSCEQFKWMVWTHKECRAQSPT
jgi:hypothetical protein